MMRRFFSVRMHAFSIAVLTSSILLGLAMDLLTIPLTWMFAGMLSMLFLLFYAFAGVRVLVYFFAAATNAKKRIEPLVSGSVLTISLCLAPLFVGIFSGLDLYFRINQGRYYEAVEYVLAGEYERNGRNVHLLDRHSGLAMANCVWLYRRGEATDILFISQGFGGEVSGYVYSSDAQKPMPGAWNRPVSGSDGNWYRGNNDGCEIWPVGLDPD